MVEKSRIIEEYEINPYTMLIMPIEYGTRTYTEIHEGNETLVSPFKPFEIIKKSCEFFGSSYQGRKDGTKRLTGITHKAPIIVDPHSSIYLFPTTSPAKSECIWISHDHVLSYTKLNSKEISVTFRNRRSFTLPMSFASFEAQMMRTAMLRINFQHRILNADRKSSSQNFGVFPGRASEHVPVYAWGQKTSGEDL
ncbi:transcriptional regulator [Rossellomorea vietnamensis]|uniref:Transcriptional regulator n=2 Tax=Rossellomorea TaxID=2837508 RepID=A0A5D4KKK4_9BACI|nr:MULTISPECIES: competence protein ComK [Rossellomorea]TYR77854.1 transcriptional regulator [Rossellomorea vietnamensis]TYS83316.1 transcriptional regulator [Rossellomorea aquimaris]